MSQVNGVSLDDIVREVTNHSSAKNTTSENVANRCLKEVVDLM